MSVQVVAGYPQYADANIAYIPQLYAAQTLVKYYAASVMAAISNTKYEGQIKDMGDKVIIRQRPTITTFPYKKGQKLNPETPSAAPLELLIDQAEAYDFVIDTIDEKQADIVLADEFTTDASEQMKIAIETKILNAIYASAHAKNKGAAAGAKSGLFGLGVSGTPIGLTKANIIEYITAVKAVLKEQNVPDGKMWMVLPEVFRWLIVNSDLKNASLTGDSQSILRNGRIGEIDGMTIYSSNLLNSVTDGSYTAWHIIAGNLDALTFAAQLVKNEVVPAQSTFGKEYRGLQVYGYKVVKPEGLVDLYAYKA